MVFEEGLIGEFDLDGGTDLESDERTAACFDFASARTVAGSRGSRS